MQIHDPFLAASINNADELLSALRFAFGSLLSDGVLVRGGIAVGTYNEIQSAAQKLASSNIVSSIFSGSGVVGAVQIEGKGQGSLLFVTDSCANLYNNTYKEPIFMVDDKRFLGWTDDDQTLFALISISLFRLLKLLSTGYNIDISRKLVNNIRYAFSIQMKDSFEWILVSLILSAPIISYELREKAIDELGIDQTDLEKIPSDMVDNWFKRDDIRLLIGLADLDSSIPQSSLLAEMIEKKENSS